jgi:hypothetical protein
VFYRERRTEDETLESYGDLRAMRSMSCGGQREIRLGLGCMTKINNFRYERLANHRPLARRSFKPYQSLVVIRFFSTLLARLSRKSTR